MTIDIKDFYLNTLMAQYEYMRLKLCSIPEKVIKHYDLTTYDTEKIGRASVSYVGNV